MSQAIRANVKLHCRVEPLGTGGAVLYGVTGELGRDFAVVHAGQVAAPVWLQRGRPVCLEISLPPFGTDEPRTLECVCSVCSCATCAPGLLIELAIESMAVSAADSRGFRARILSAVAEESRNRNKPTPI